MTDRTFKHRRPGLLLLALSLLFGGLAAGPAQAQTGQRCFAETAQCISGPIRAYWERSGGLPIFGYPISPQRVETVEGQQLSVQWFERDRLEDHGAQGVLAGRLGARLLELTERPWEYFAKRDLSERPAGCLFAEPTGHTLCEPFLSYWQRNGGLMRFGYPVTQPFTETIEEKSYTVQYFERRRMESHPELSGSPVLLGLLGREVLNTPEPEPAHRYPECLGRALPSLRPAVERLRLEHPLGCPADSFSPGGQLAWQGLAAATQPFEHGLMIWTDQHPLVSPRGHPYSSPPQIWALSEPGPQFEGYEDTWKEGIDADTPPDTPPHAGLYAPWRGFGKVWAEHPELRARIGWATEPQVQARTADHQIFRYGSLLRVNETGRIYAANSDTNRAQVIEP
jgi:hypothetical protein